MHTSGRIGSNGDANPDPRLTGVVAAWPVPFKYWKDTGEVDPETGDSVYENDFVQMVEAKPDYANVEIQVDGAWLDTTQVATEVTAALDRLWTEHDRIIDANVTDTGKRKGKDTKLIKSLRAESKGQATQKDLDRLNDNDTLDTWYDDMETAAETEGETWIEDPTRTVEELRAFDPVMDVTWPPFPL